MIEIIFCGFVLWGMCELVCAFPKAFLVAAFLLFAFGVQPSKDMPTDVRSISVAISLTIAIVAAIKLFFFS
jgi:hypothetical protein